MTEKEQKNKSGAGKFFLGAALGAIAGAAAAKLFQVKVSHSEKELEDSIADATDSLSDADEETIILKKVKSVKPDKPEKKEKKEKKDDDEDED
jgi:hypothetical protein